MINTNKNSFTENVFRFNFIAKIEIVTFNGNIFHLGNLITITAATPESKNLVMTIFSKNIIPDNYILLTSS